MDAQLHGEAFDLQCRLFGIGLSVGIKQVVILLNGSTEVFVDAPHVTLHERRRKVRLQSGIRTAFGNHTLAHVAYRIDVKMRRRPDQCIRPVAAAQGDLLAWRELQRAVGAEVHHHVSFESVARPKVGGDIGVRRRGIRAVDDGKVVVARTRRQLRQQHHISQFYTRQCQPAVVGSNITPRKLAVECHDLRHPLGANRCSRPLGILLRRDRFGIAVFQKIGLSTARIGVEHATLTLNQLF